jgi:chorismate synthase
VPAAAVVLENVVGFEVARALRQKFGGDSMAEVRAQYDAYLALARRMLAGG